MDKVTRFGISLPADVLKEYDEVIQRNGYSNRSKAILDLVRSYIKEETSGNKNGHVLEIKYNHRNIKNISEVGNSYPCTVTSSYNVHLDLNFSLMIINLYGEEQLIKKIIGKYQNLGSSEDITIIDVSNPNHRES